MKANKMQIIKKGKWIQTDCYKNKKVLAIKSLTAIANKIGCTISISEGKDIPSLMYGSIFSEYTWDLSQINLTKEDMVKLAEFLLKESERLV